jgi:acetylornithine deacetylase/succinyl-diaminopimelate desuccinylase-like protein
VTPADVDRDLLWRLFDRFVAVGSGARVGENRIPPDDPRVVAFAHEAAAPALAELGGDVRIDELNNVVCTFGELRGAELLFVAYPALHHGNEMADPLRARRDGEGEDERWIGLGAGQSKGALAAVCAAVELLRRDGVDLAGRMAIAVSSEGGSSHTSARALYAGLDQLPAGAVLVVGTENRISLGNRGRIDVVVEIRGRSTHSSSPWLGENPIPVVAQVQARLDGLDLGAEAHPALGPRALVPYKLECGPVAPHTIPAWCRLVLDRRTLPGDTEPEVLAQVADALAGLPVDVSAGPVMHPALVEDDDTVVRALQAGAMESLGHPLETFYPPYTFDAGYPCSLGVPTVMCGPSSPEIAGEGILGEDAVLAGQLTAAAAFYAGAVAALR